ncbi:MAG: choice-of-anchor Q domain-containing protein, partial [Planctomycetota bacterium]
CILWGNTAPSAPEMMVGNVGAPASVNISYCDIQGLSAGVVVNSGSTVNWGPGNINLDPLFTSSSYMASSEGYTEDDYHLHNGSPCINAGDPDFVADAGQTDIDGDARISGTGVDIGADEVTAAVLAIQAIVKVTPKALNLASKGNWITCSIALGDDYNIGDVIVDSVKLNDTLTPVRTEINEDDQKMLVKFDRSLTQNMLSDDPDVQDTALMTITGSLQGGPDFEGDDTIKIVETGSKK